MDKKIIDITPAEYRKMSKEDWGNYAFKQGLKAREGINQTMSTTYLFIGLVVGFLYGYILGHFIK